MLQRKLETEGLVYLTTNHDKSYQEARHTKLMIMRINLLTTNHENQIILTIRSINKYIGS